MTTIPLVILNFSRVDQTPSAKSQDAIWQPCDVHRLYNKVVSRCKSKSGSLPVRHTARKIPPYSQQDNIIYIKMLTQYCWGDIIEKNDMGGACSANVGEERRMQGFGGET